MENVIINISKSVVIFITLEEEELRPVLCRRNIYPIPYVCRFIGEAQLYFGEYLLP